MVHSKQTYTATIVSMQQWVMPCSQHHDWSGTLLTVPEGAAQHAGHMTQGLSPAGCLLLLLLSADSTALAAVEALRRGRAVGSGGAEEPGRHSRRPVATGDAATKHATVGSARRRAVGVGVRRGGVVCGAVQGSFDDAGQQEQEVIHHLHARNCGRRVRKMRTL